MLLCKEGMELLGILWDLNGSDSFHIFRVRVSNNFPKNVITLSLTFV